MLFCFPQLAERLSTVNEEYKALKERLDGVREVLIREIGGEDAYPSQCKCASPKECTCKLDHVSLKQLVRLKFQRAGLVSSRVSFATTLALRVDQARATSAASTERPPAGEKEDSYAEDGFDGDVTASAGEAGSGEGKDDGGSSLSPAAHITQSEQRIKQLRAYSRVLLSCLNLPPLSRMLCVWCDPLLAVRTLACWKRSSCYWRAVQM